MRPISLFRPAALLAVCAMFLMAPAAFAQPVPSTDGIFRNIFDNFQAGGGDNYSNLFFSLIFGPLFPNPIQGGEPGPATLFSVVIIYLNYAVLAVMTLLLLYNVSVGVVQSAHEGKPLGQRYSSLWAPLRVLFAYTLAIPVPSIGYNVAQVFVAWIAKGATWFASWIWSTAITLFVSGVVPVAPPIQQITPEAVSAMWENAACRAITNENQRLSGTTENLRVTLVPASPTTFRNPDTGNRAGQRFMSGTNPPDSSYQNRCGSFQTPDVPLYVQQRQAGLSLITSASDANAIETAFTNGHAAIATRFATRLSSIAEDYVLTMRNPSASLPTAAVSARLREAMNEANSSIATLNNQIMNMAIGVDDTRGNAAREAMIDRISGGAGCSYTGDSNAAMGSESCFGEGWIGAGAWYMTIARLNSELSSLMQSSIEVERQNAFDLANRDSVLSTQRVISGGGSLSPPYEDELRNSSEFTMARYMETFRQAANQMAAYGFMLSTEDAVEISQFGTTDPGNWFTRAMQWISDQVREQAINILDYVSPSLNGLDPMVNISSLGNILLDLVSTVMAADAMSDRLNIWTITLPLLAAGIFMSYVLPMMPFIFWVMGVIGYFLVVVEAIVAMPLWALGHMRLDGDGISGESGRIGWMMLLAIMITPALMILGYLVGMIIFRVAVIIIHVGIRPLASSLLSGSAMSSVYGTAAIMLMLCFLYLFMLERSFSLVSSLSGKVLRILNGGIEILDNADIARGRSVASAGTATISAGASGTSKALNAMRRRATGGGSITASG